MHLLQSFRLAAKSIWDNKMRAFLTMLGMIIGVGSVIILTGLVNGVSNYVVDMFADMGSNMLTVSVSNTDSRFVTPDQMYELADEYPDIFTGVSPSVTGSFTVKKGSASLSRQSVSGVGEGYADINHLTLSAGRFISYGDIKTRNRVCVIGTYQIGELFGSNDVLGDTVKINGEEYTIVGIVEETEDGEENSADDCIYIPYSNASRMNWSADIKAYVFATPDADYVDRAESILDSFLYDKMKDESLYSIMTMTALMDSMTSMTDMLSGILGGIAGISLLVAGIGIMNIMLVSVVERTREIGIRKALGARKRNILWQFVIEAGSISSLGGIVGIIIGSVACVNIGNLFGLRAEPTAGSILMAFGVSAAIGIFFGYMPARRAAGLNPIEALRSE